jgi:drug/metabolite transporter (DMT)-like permease
MAGPALALVVNAFVWGVSWWPFRQLGQAGLHPLWATTLIYWWRWWRWRSGGRAPGARCWRTCAVGAGAGFGHHQCRFQLGVTIGDVVRVVLLFYLMPLWAVLLARLLLHERLTRLALLRVALALGGAMVILWPEGGGWPLPRTLPEFLGVLGGFAFALNNVMLRREAARSEGARAMAMFAGGALVAAVLATC